MFNKKTYRIYKKINKIKFNLKLYQLCNLNNIIKKNKRNNLLCYFVFFNKNSIKLNNKNLCSVTGKYKSIFNSLKISRHVIHKYGETSNLANYSKLSW